MSKRIILCIAVIVTIVALSSICTKKYTVEVEKVVKVTNDYFLYENKEDNIIRVYFKNSTVRDEFLGDYPDLNGQFYMTYNSFTAEYVVNMS